MTLLSRFPEFIREALATLFPAGGLATGLITRVKHAAALALDTGPRMGKVEVTQSVLDFVGDDAVHPVGEHALGGLEFFVDQIDLGQDSLRDIVKMRGDQRPFLAALLDLMDYRIISLVKCEVFSLWDKLGRHDKTGGFTERAPLRLCP